jgi:hypothetical protein
MAITAALIAYGFKDRLIYFVRKIGRRVDFSRCEVF